jgi:myo-inositol 2-dehydrogenase / D-chiro-inositol 1-dehydrogenase
MNNQTNPVETADNRRGFLKTAATAGAALTLPIELCAQVGGSDQKKVALVGCGGRGSGAVNQHMSSKEGNAKLVAVADINPGAMSGIVDTMKRKFPDRVDVPDSRKFEGLDGYQAAIAEADTVILASPPGFRPFHFKAAIEAGKHVFSEKPTCVDGPGYRMYRDAAQLADTKNLKVVVGLQRHYQNVYLATLAKVKEGLIGQITGGQVYWNSGGVWVRERKPQDTEMQYQTRNWYYFTWLSGDHIVEQHVHNIDVFQWFLSESLGLPNEKPVAPISAQGMGGRQTRTDKKFGQIFDHFFVEYTYANGVILNSQCRHSTKAWSSVSETIVGEKAICYPAQGLIKDRSGKILWKYNGEDDPDPYQTEHDMLHKAIREGTPLNNAYYGNQSSMVASFGRMAVYGGKNIKWDDAVKSDFTEFPDKLSWDAPTKVNPDANGQYPVPVPGETVAL